jgi:hypothetical protein
MGNQRKSEKVNGCVVNRRSTAANHFPTLKSGFEEIRGPWGAEILGIYREANDRGSAAF